MRRILTKPLNGKSMWRRKALTRAHHDGGGEHDLFVWIQAVRDAMCNGGGTAAEHHPPRREPRSEPPSKPEPKIVHEDGRVPFPEVADFEQLTAKALEVAGRDPSDAIARILVLLDGCVSLPSLYREESRGATYRQCAYAARLSGLSYEQRQAWYRACEFVPLSQRHLGHLIQRLKEEGATT